MSSILTGRQLAELCAAQEGSAYIWGGLGHIITEAYIGKLKALYSGVFTDSYVAKCRKNIGKKSYDCVGLLKHFLWGNTGNGVLKHYNVNGIPDTTANGLFALCGVTGKLAALPEKPGLLLHKDGHVGVYLGGGKLVEARGVDYGVVITNVADRVFSGWGELPGVEYPETTAAKTITLSELSALLAGQGIGAISL